MFLQADNFRRIGLEIMYDLVSPFGLECGILCMFRACLIPLFENCIFIFETEKKKLVLETFFKMLE